MTDSGQKARDRATTGVWPLIRTERAALANDLTGIAEERWETPSLCAGLTVREVLAHLTAGASLTPARWFAGVIRCRFDFDRQVALRLAEQLGEDGAETLERFRRVVSSTTKPPLPKMAMLGEAIVHAEDIRRPLGLRRDYPITVLTALAGYYQGADMVVMAKGRIGGLRLEATDGPFAVGSGPLVSGTTLALIMAMTGRAAYLADLSGDGVSILRQRVPSQD
ncbi:maleylpyruvate isomerase family mycothiol-dependent enzyme [Amycolatopsis speibonae]|uniref:Maleylpyruvate isomerase family mycothiol-dependent enzyme n=1 Tax=Amycolatopsis speibonae TaxID=1450224 RepID=A0ABV7NVS1_9PSEU